MNVGDPSKPGRAQPCGAPAAGPRSPSDAKGMPAGTITDIAFDADIARPESVSVAGAAIGIALCIGFAAVFSGMFAGGPVVQGVLFLAPFLAGIVLLRSWSRRRAEREVRELPAAIGAYGLVGAVGKTLVYLRGWGAAHGVRELVRALLGLGRAGTTLRIARPYEMPALEPLDYPFEPQPLNESQSLLIAQAPGAIEQPARLPSSTRWMRRNIILKGGWVMLVAFTLNWAVALLDTVSRRTIDWHLLLWSVLLTALLLVPANREFKQQWFVVPGAMVLRKAGWLQGRWTLHLFQRGESVLCVSHWRQRIWMAAVVDGHTHARRAVTRTEAEFLLRAWLSPLPPPPIERLSDLG